MQDKIINVLSETLGAASKPYDNALLRDFSDWDSMSHMLLVTKIEGSFDIQFTGEEIADLRSVQELISLVESKLGSKQ